jgi:hypothetical protein
MKYTAQYIWQALQSPDSYFMMILLVAFVAGIHGLIVLYKLNTQKQEIAIDARFLLAIFNIVISLSSVCAVFVMMQINTNMILKQAGELLAQIK